MKQASTIAVILAAIILLVGGGWYLSGMFTVTPRVSQPASSGEATISSADLNTTIASAESYLTGLKKFGNVPVNPNDIPRGPDALFGIKPVTK